MAREPLIQTRKLSVQRGQRRLVSELDFELHAGEVVHMTGANGAGKTSLMRVLAGLALVESGDLVRSGKTLYLGHALGLKPELSAIENLLFYARLASVSGAESRVEQALNTLGLLSRADLLVGQLSAGQKRRVALARLLIEPAQLWLLDEPFSALDVKTCDWLCKQIDEFVERGGALLFTSHQSVTFHSIVRVMQVA